MNGEMSQSEGERPGAKEQNSIETVLAYHRRTKHHLHRFAASPGYLDWATQPDPFRTYIGAERVELPLLVLLRYVKVDDFVCKLCCHSTHTLRSR
jgi:hypothetical protein